VSEVRKRLAIIDGKSVFYRGYYAMPNLSTKEGVSTGGVYGFAVMALEVIKKIKPDYVCVAWDKPKTNIRKRLELFPAYKAGRKPAPSDFYEQIPLLHELLDAFGWPLYGLDDYEADDIMGTLSVQAAEKGLDTALITSDLDMLQVINENVHVYALKKGLSNIDLFHPERFKEKYGIEVEQFLDLKALKGDSSDNIPGAPGIGEKTAVALLQDYKTLDNIYKNLDEIKETTRKKLIEGKELVELSKKLASIWTDAPMKLDLKEVDGSKCDPSKVAEVLQRLEFRTLARQLPEYMNVPEEVAKKESKKVSLPELITITNDDELDNLTLPKTDLLVVHGLSQQAHGVGPLYLTLSPNDKQSIHFDLTKLDADKFVEKLSPYLEGSSLIGHNVKSVIKLLNGLNIYPANIEHDTLVGAFLINSLRREQSLHEIAETELDLHMSDVEENHAESVAVIRKLYEGQIIQLKDLPKVARLAKEIEWPMIPVLAEMEFRGISLDTDYLKKFDEELKDQLSDIEQQIYGHADEEFNIASPVQLAEVLFEKIKLPTQGIKKGKTGYSTAANELDKLRGSHPIIDLITGYREVAKLMNTYVEPLPEQVDQDSRLHTTYNMAVAPTGRLSSERPNLQNIPIRSELGRKIRAAFVADEGKLLISADYSQIELRIAALLADDKELIDMFNRDVDVHTATAAQVYGREPEDVTKNMRRDAKVINFGILYGMSPHGLSIATGMTLTAAKEFIDRYFELRKPILDYINKTRELARDQGYVETYFGRRRPTPDVKSSNFMVRQAAERAAINMPLQGTAADVMKIAMIKLDKMLKKYEDAFMLLQIHDSVLVECHEHDSAELVRDIQKTMEEAVKLNVKLTVDTTIGKNWGDL
jgi:DNA polymerase I